jgi:carbon monoxide dehydrogenase subunit G
MEMKGERRLPASREVAWVALNDPAMLKAAIPGCEAIERTAEDAFKVTMATAMGPVRARFGGLLRLEDVVVHERYTIRFEGQGGAAGFAKGSAQVTLLAVGEETLLSYLVNAQIGGRIAQVGSRLVDSAALKLADGFFEAFARLLAATGPAATVPTATVPTADVAAASAPTAGVCDNGAANQEENREP